MKALGLVIAAVAANNRYLKQRTTDHMLDFLRVYESLDDHAFRVWAERMESASEKAWGQPVTV